MNKSSRQKLYSIQKFMAKKHLSKKTQVKIKKYLEHLLETENENRLLEENVLSTFSESLRDEIVKEINGRVLRESLLFQINFGSKFLSILYNHLEEKTYSPGELIFGENDREFSLYFISSGRVELFFQGCHRTLDILTKNASFGEYSFFTGSPRTASAQSMNFSILFQISKVTFLNLLNDFPIERETFCFIKDSVNLYSQFEKLKIKCLACDREGHYAKFCPSLHYIAPVEDIIARGREEDTEFRKSFERNARRKQFHARADLEKIVAAAKKLSIIGSINSLKNLQDEAYLQDNQSQSSYDERMEVQFNSRRRVVRDVFRKKESYKKSSRDNIDTENKSDANEAEDERNRSGSDKKFERTFRARKSYRKGANIIQEVKFDSVKNFAIYFPHNNIARIILAMKEERIKQQKKKEIKTEVGQITKILTKKFTNQETRSFKTPDISQFGMNAKS